MYSMKPRAITNISKFMLMSGPNASSNCNDRMSLLAREMTSPDWVRS